MFQTADFCDVVVAQNREKREKKIYKRTKLTEQKCIGRWLWITTLTIQLSICFWVSLKCRIKVKKKVYTSKSK